MKERLSPDLESKFPSLFNSGYEVKSLKDKKYNCVAWAANLDKEQWWEPWSTANEKGYFWPDGVTRSYDFESFVELFVFLGFVKCLDSGHEIGFEKIAIYRTADGWFSHVSKQLPSGIWISKLGPDEDIEHSTPQALESEIYGNAVVFLKKSIVL